MERPLTLYEAKECLGIFLPMSLSWDEMSDFYALESIAKGTQIKLYPFPLSFLNNGVETRASELIAKDYNLLDPDEAESLYIQKTKEIIKQKSYIFGKLKDKILIDKINQ